MVGCFLDYEWGLVAAQQKGWEPVAHSAWLKWKSASANPKQGKQKFATKYMCQIEIWKVLIKCAGTTVLSVVCKAGISRKCPEATSCSRKPEWSMELNIVLRDVRCWHVTVIWFWKFRVQWNRPVLSETQLHCVTAQEEGNDCWGPNGS